MRTLYILVFTAGAVTLGMELSASRLLEPAFGNNQIVWAALIGLILFSLAVGAWLGGRLADRYPHRREFHLMLTAAAVAVATVPLLSAPVLRLAAQGMASFQVDLLASALLAVALLFSLPAVLLGTAGPWAVRLALADVSHSGSTAGRLYATSTAGSLVGTFLPVLWLIPAFGTRWTFFLLALTLLAVVAAASLAHRHRWAPLAGMALVALAAVASAPGGPIRAGWDSGERGAILYEDESRYNYIAVRQWGSERHLKLNDGIGIHSVYHPDMLLSRGIWDYFLLAPLFRQEFAAKPQEPAGLESMLLLGLAAGTVSELFTDVYGPLPITGVELDPQIIAVGREFFAMNQPNLTAVAADGRRWLADQPAQRTWDLIAVDAYRPPYIPFHLTTVEFFQLVRSHLSADGVLAVNVGRAPGNDALVDALTATLAEVFPAVVVIDEPGPPGALANSLVVATVQPGSLAIFEGNLVALPTGLPAEFVEFATAAGAAARPASFPADAPLFTDDRAPVERVVHGIILDYLRGGDAASQQ